MRRSPMLQWPNWRRTSSRVADLTTVENRLFIESKMNKLKIL